MGGDTVNLSAEQQVDLYRTMARIRAFETEMLRLFRRGQIRGPL